MNASQATLPFDSEIHFLPKSTQQAWSEPVSPSKARFEYRIAGHFKVQAETWKGFHSINAQINQSVEGMVSRWREKLHTSNSTTTTAGKTQLDEAYFEISPTCAVAADSSFRDWGSDCLIVAETLAEANRTHRELVQIFGARVESFLPDLPFFSILALEGQRIRAHKIQLVRQPSFSDELLILSYGEGFDAWAGQLRRTFQSQSSSLTLLQGPPGTGKTSFLRWLISRVHGEVDFYFVPVTCIDLLSNPNLTSFWLRECRYSTRPKVLLVEDAEMLLMRRGPENGHWVGNLLNITDGIMGDALRFHMVCTINCPLSDVDPALLRPGRLAASWNFRPLRRANAQKLSALLGKCCPPGDTITLSDLYCQPVSGESLGKPGIGFHAG